MQFFKVSLTLFSLLKLFCRKPLVRLKDEEVTNNKVERHRRYAMISLIVEAVLLAFCVGGAVGAVITMHLQHNTKRAEVKVQQEPQV